MLLFLLALFLQTNSSTLVANVNGWSVYDQRGSCAIIAHYDGNVWVRVSFDYGTDTSFFSITNPAWESIQSETTYNVTLRFDNGSTYDTVRARGLRFENSDGRHTGIWMSMNANDFLPDFGLARSVAITMGNVRVDSIRLRGTRDAVQRLVRCATESHRRYPPDPFANATSSAPGSSGTSLDRVVPPQRARANLNTYFSVDDYPAAALGAASQGTTGFRLTIGPSGRVTDCQITSSSGSLPLDEATCRILRSRARYTPARDGSGNPTTGTDSGRVTWRLPAEVPADAAGFGSVSTAVASLESRRNWVQLAIGNDLSAMRVTFDRLRERAPALLAGRTPYSVPFGSANRLLVGPFDSENAATAFARQLAARGVQGHSWVSAEGQAIEPLAR